MSVPATSTGLDWATIATLITATVVVVGAFTTWIGRQITHAINDMSDKLTAKLETKDAVAAINSRLQAVEITLRERHDQ
jgi:trans-2-enoyl-CoA reductase